MARKATRMTARKAKKYVVKAKHVSSITKYTVYILQIVLVIALSYLGVKDTPFVQGIGLLYWAYPVFVLFTLWWGIWGVAGAYIGSLVGAGLFAGLSPAVSILFSTGDLVAAILILILYRSTILKKQSISPYGSDILSNPKAFAWFISWIVVVTNVLGGLIGVTILLELGFVTAATYSLNLGVWIVGDAIVLILFPFLSKCLTPIMERKGLLQKF